MSDDDAKRAFHVKRTHVGPEGALRHKHGYPARTQSARSEQVERIVREEKPRLPVSAGEQRPHDAMVKDASHRADGLLVVRSSALETHRSQTKRAR